MFTATGTQVITLLAVGKPAATGTFDFNLNIGGGNCKVPVTVTATGGNGGGGTITGEYYYKLTADGVTYSQDVTETNDYETGSGMGGVDEVVFGGGINYKNYPLPTGKTDFGIDKGMMRNYINATKAQFYAYFAPGDYSYAPEDYDDGDGVRIYWTDPTGQQWDTGDGRTDQAGSTFKIISVEDALDVLGRVYIKVKVQFSCKFYNPDTGASKQVTNGEAVVVFGML